MLAFLLNPARYFRKRPCKKYPDRFIQDVDYIEFVDDVYKYMMIKDRTIFTNILGIHIDHKYFTLTTIGALTIREGYKWDGPSGPTIDTPSFMRSSAVHDVFYQMLREGLVKDERRQMLFKQSNEELKRIGVKDGMLETRANYVQWSVDNFGEKHTLKKVA